MKLNSDSSGSVFLVKWKVCDPGVRRSVKCSTFSGHTEIFLPLSPSGLKSERLKKKHFSGQMINVSVLGLRTAQLKMVKLGCCLR